MLTAFYSWRNKSQIKNYVRQVDSKGSLRSRVLAHGHRVGEGGAVVLWTFLPRKNKARNVSLSPEAWAPWEQHKTETESTWEWKN